MADSGDFETLDPSLKNVLDQKTLKWVFVGGKGGVGKTTCRYSFIFLLHDKKNTENFLVENHDFFFQKHQLGDIPIYRDNLYI